MYVVYNDAYYNLYVSKKYTYIYYRLDGRMIFIKNTRIYFID